MPNSSACPPSVPNGVCNKKDRLPTVATIVIALQSPTGFRLLINHIRNRHHRDCLHAMTCSLSAHAFTMGTGCPRVFGCIGRFCSIFRCFLSLLSASSSFWCLLLLVSASSAAASSAGSTASVSVVASSAGLSSASGAVSCFAASSAGLSASFAASSVFSPAALAASAAFSLFSRLSCFSCLLCCFLSSH